MTCKMILFFLACLCITAFAQEKGTFTDSRDSKTYKWVKIGEQVWMSENLNYEAKGSKCYDNDLSNCQKYGRLYDWNTAMKVCPSGWHLPSDAEWGTLVDFAGGKKVAGAKLKARGGWETYKGESGNGTNTYGFSALPGGSSIFVGNFYGAGHNGLWWSSSEYGASYAYGRGMGYISENAGWYYYDKSRLFSVRCLRD